jgi:flagellar biosynthetic protein FliR
MTEVEALLLSVQSAFLAHGLVFLRVGAATALLPAFGETTLPARVRLMAAIALSFVTASSLGAPLPSATPLVFLSEPLIGVMLGLSFRMFVFALQTAGTIAAQSTSLSQLSGGAGIDPMPALAQTLTLAGLTLLVLLDVHVVAAKLFILSYQIFPMGQLPAPGPSAEWILRHASRAFSLGFQLSAPFLVVSLAYNLALGAINRAMPQLMVAFVGAPFITWLSLLLLAALAAPILSLWARLVLQAAGSFPQVP